MLEVYIDGACAPVNPGGTASYGVVVLRKDGVEPVNVQGRGTVYKKEGVVVWEDHKVVGSGPKMSNNVGEYSGLIAFLEWYTSQKGLLEQIIIYSDSNMLVQQMTGKFKVKKGLYVPYYEKATDIINFNAKMWSGIEFRWIPREANTFADALSVKALEEVGIHRG